MAFTEKLRIVIDTVADKTGLNGFKTSVKEASGFAGKFKAGWTSATDTIKAHAGQLAVAGGAALIAFGVKAVKAFEETATAALNMSKVTGQSVEAASRWIAVGKDYEVGADTITAAMIKVGKNGGDFVDSLVKINEAAPADRMRVAFELFGKSAAGIAPLLGKTRGEYEKMLGAVEKGQVITDGEAKTAERMRLAQDALADAVGEVTLAFGGFVAELAPMIEKGTAAATTVLGLAEELGGLKNALDLVSNPVGSVFDGTAREALLGLEGGVIAATVAADALPVSLADVADGARDLGDGAKEAAQKAYGLEAAADETADKIARVTREAGYAETALKNLQDEIDGDQSWNALQLNLLGIGDELANAKKAFDDGGLSAQEYALTVKGITLDAKADITDYALSLGGIPRDVITKVLSEFDPNNAQASFDELQAWFDSHSVTIKPVAVADGANPYGATGRGGEDSVVNFTANIVIDGKTISAISKKVTALGKGMF